MAQAQAGNVGAYSTGNVFGADADVIRQQIEDQARQQDVALATAPNLNMGVVLGQQAGRAAGNFVAGAAGYQDPRVREAKAMEDAAREVDSAGFSLMDNPDAYYRAAYAALNKRGLYDAAGKVHDIMVQQASAVAEAKAKAMTAQAALDSAHKPIVGKNGLALDYTGQVIRQPDATAASKAQVTLAPPGTTLKGRGTEKTFNLSTPEGAAAYNDHLAQGWVDTSKLPAPPTPSQVTVNQGQKFIDSLAEGPLKEIMARGANGSQLYTQAKQANEALMNGDASVGLGSDVFSSVGKILDFMHINPETIKALGIDPGDQAALKSLHQQMVGNIAQMSSMGGNRISAKELQLLQDAGPQVWQTRAGQFLINKLTMANAEVDMKVQDKAAELFKDKKYQDNPIEAESILNRYKVSIAPSFDKDFQEGVKNAYNEAVEVKKLKTVQSYFTSSQAKNVKVNDVFNLNGQKAYFSRWDSDGSPIFSASPIQSK